MLSVFDDGNLDVLIVDGLILDFTHDRLNVLIVALAVDPGNQCEQRYNSRGIVVLTSHLTVDFEGLSLRVRRRIRRARDDWNTILLGYAKLRAPWHAKLGRMLGRRHGRRQHAM